MIDLLKNKNVKNCLLTIILKSVIYFCWYLFAVVFSIFIYDYLSDTKIFICLIFICVIYLFRNIFKYLHNKDASNNYQNFKHSIELNYFSKIEKSNIYFNDIELKNVGKMILDFSYRATKTLFDIGEVVIPLILGLIILYHRLFQINVIISILSIIYLIFLVIVRYKRIDVINIHNYNDLLNNFINNFNTIRKLRIFDFCLKKLDENKDNDMLILNKSNDENDIKFSNGMILYMLIILLMIFFNIKNNVTRVGLFFFFIVIMLKLQNLLYDLPYTIKNYLYINKNKDNLDKKYAKKLNIKYISNFKSVEIKDAEVDYKSSDVIIHIPSFELLKGESVGILGKSGQGKSTVLNVLSGYLPMDKGCLLVDEKETKNVMDVVYLSKDVNLLDLSLRDNISLGKKVSDEKILEYIEEIGLNDWYLSLDNGLDTIITNVSDVVLRSINIIRAIVLDKNVYFFDEITLGMNLDGEKKVVAMLKKYFKDKTFIIISDRPILNNICSKHYFIKNHTLLEKESLL